MGLTDEQAQAIEDVLAKKTGPKNRGKMMVTSADLKWQQIGMSPVDLAIIESDKMDLRTLCNVFHVPSELFNDASNKTYSNTQEASKAIWTNAVIPALTQFRDAMNLFIAGKYGDVFIDYDTSVIPELQEDMERLVNQLMNAWWITPNEKRELMAWDSEPIPEMDMMWIPSSLVPMNGWAEQEAAREQEAEADLRSLDDEEPSDEDLTEELKRLGINDYGTKGE
jgi:HK97 family phage portal protein